MVIYRCIVCKAEKDVGHFHLSVKGVKADGSPTRRGAGRIDLCRQCWAKANEEAALRPRRRTPRRVTVDATPA